jgi:hypothetical protein
MCLPRAAALLPPYASWRNLVLTVPPSFRIWKGAGSLFEEFYSVPQVLNYFIKPVSAITSSSADDLTDAFCTLGHVLVCRRHD